MLKKAVILLSFLAYSLTLVHSIVPHHHHDKQATSHFHAEFFSCGDHRDETSLGHAFADAIHFPGSENVISSQQSAKTVKVVTVIELQVHDIVSLLLPQLTSPDINEDRRQAHYSSTPRSLFLLRAPPVA